MRVNLGVDKPKDVDMVGLRSSLAKLGMEKKVALKMGIVAIVVLVTIGAKG